MTFTVAKIIAFNGLRGLAEDGYGNIIHFYKEQVFTADLPLIKEEASVLVYASGFIEEASASFGRFAR